MTVDLTLLAFAGAAALLFNFLWPRRWASWFVLGLSIVTLFWLQPPLPIRWSGFLLPFLTLILISWSWWATRPAGAPSFDRQTWLTLAFVAGLVLLLAGVRYLPLGWRPTLNRPPGIEIIFIMLGVVGSAFWFIGRRQAKSVWLLVIGLLVIGLFVGLKSSWLAEQLAFGWRAVLGQNPELATAGDIAWLGYSYIAFRLLHTLRDRQLNQLPALSLQEYLAFVLFFPALPAGPIDRAERFAPEWRQLSTLDRLDGGRWQAGLTRIAFGLGKKFVLADSLALGLSLTPDLAAQTTHSGWLWVLLYGYALRLYFDFSGYTDMAIGLGILFGITLPENFSRPYWQSSLTEFWQSWHITLSSWVRFYVFSPLSRALLRRKPRPSPTLIVLVSQLTTMIIIGLWHGITVNFLIWGIWHGLGLFVHKMWSDRTRKWYRELQTRPRAFAAWRWFGRLLTFHYVVLGWVWFVIPTVGLALETFGKLMGFVN